MLLSVVTLAFGCDSETPRKGPAIRVSAAHSEGAGEIVCSVAASVREVFEAAVALGKSTERAEVRINSGPSSGLASQIQAGAPVDIFLSASAEWGTHLQSQGLTVQWVPLLTNRLALVVPKGRVSQIRDPRDLSHSRVQHVSLAGESVPAGKYAAQALGRLGVLGGLVAAGKIVRGQDVRAALAFVERGEAEAGIVYVTDARASGLVDVVYEFSPELHEPIEYVLVLLKHGQDKREVVALFEWLQSTEVRTLFEAAGFQRLPAVPPQSAEF